MTSGSQLNVEGLLQPKATAMWLIDNTTLTFEQIADFTDLHQVEIQALADGEIGRGIQGRDPVKNRELTSEEIRRCEQDESASLQMMKTDLPKVKIRSKGPKYTPVAKRGEKPDAILYLLKNHPELSDAQITKLVGTTKNTIESIRNKTHSNMANLKARNPTELGLCSYEELNEASRKSLKAQGRDPDAEQQARQEEAEAQKVDESTETGSAGFDFSNFLRNYSGENN
jgi:hypothetical protein